MNPDRARRERKRSVHTYLSEQEYAQLEALAKQVGLSISAWLRVTIRERHRELLRIDRAQAQEGAYGTDRGGRHG